MAAAFDPFQDAYMENPSEFVRWAREEQPVFYSPKWITGWSRATRRSKIFSATRSHSAPPMCLNHSANARLKRPTSQAIQLWDEPYAGQRRRTRTYGAPSRLDGPFTPEHLREHEPMVRRWSPRPSMLHRRRRVDLMKKLLWDVPFSVALHFLASTTTPIARPCIGFRWRIPSMPLPSPARGAKHRGAYCGPISAVSGEVLAK